MILPQLKDFETRTIHSEQEIIKNQFLNILENETITSVYQPIVDLKSGDIIGYEALSRGPLNTDFYSPLKLINMAHSLNLIWELEMLFRKKALENIHLLNPNKYLFINVDPDVIKSNEFRSGLTHEHLLKIGADETSIVFEITERTAISDYEGFQKILDNYRNQGYQIAIDDVGAGYSGLKTITETRPNFIKIDMDLIRNIDKNAFKQALIKAFVEISVTTNFKIIAEGIETKDELKTLILLGVHAGQGFYLKQPAPEFSELNEGVVSKIEQYNNMSQNLNEYAQEYHYISNLVVSMPEELTYESITQCESIKSYMETNHVKSVCICEHGQPVGIMMKHNLDAYMSGKYGYALFSNRSISKIMNTKPLIVDYFTPINVVAKKAMERTDDELYDDIVVTKGSKYFGLVSMKRIFEYTLMYEKNNAREQNPLTGLPGNPIITRVLKDIVSFESFSCIIYVDINEFKIYNDVYGFEMGDNMIKLVSNILKEEVKEKYPYSSFIGHIGGDDFIILFHGEMKKCHDLCKVILSRFESERMAYFNKDHINQNQIISEDRYGISRAFNLTSLALSGIYGDLSKYPSPEMLSENLARLKKKVKKNNGNQYLLVGC